MLSTFLLSGAEINCFEKVGVFTGEEQVINFMFITATLGTNIGILGHGEMRDPRIEVVRSGSYIHYTVLNFVRDKLPCTRKMKKMYFFSLLHFFFLLQDIQLGLLYSQNCRLRTALQNKQVFVGCFRNHHHVILFLWEKYAFNSHVI